MFIGEHILSQEVPHPTSIIEVTAPEIGEEIYLSPTKSQKIVLSFEAKAATPVIEGSDFILTFDINGDGSADSRIVFQNLIEESQGADAPIFVIDGIELSASLLVGQALALVEGETLETAAGAGVGPTGGGGSTYSDDLGDTIDLLNAQGTLGETELEFGLLGGQEDITDSAQGSLIVTFLTTTTDVEGAPKGGIVGSFEGGFEDWLPNQHLPSGDDGTDNDPFTGTVGRDPETLEFFGAPMKVVFTFIPSDNETLNSVTINEIPDGAALFVGGVEFSATDFPVTIDDADFGDVYLLPPVDSDADITLVGSGEITDPDSGEGATLGFASTAVIDAVADLPTGFDVREEGQDSPQSEEQLISVNVSVQFGDYEDQSEAHEIVIDGVPEDWDIQAIAGAKIWQMQGGVVSLVTFGADGSEILTEVTGDELPASLQHQIQLAAGVVVDPNALHSLEENIGDEDGSDEFVRYFIDVSEVIDTNGGSFDQVITFDPNDWTGSNNATISRNADGTPRTVFEDQSGNLVEVPAGPAQLEVRAVATEINLSGDEVSDPDGTIVDENNQSFTDAQTVTVSITEDIPEFTSSISLIHDETARTLTGDTVTGVDAGSDDILAVPSAVQSVLDERYKVLQGDDQAVLGDTVGQAQNTFTYDLKTDGSNDEVPDGSDGPTDTDAGTSNTFDDLEAIEFDLSMDVDSLLTSGGSVITLHQDPVNSQIVWGLDASNNVIFAVHIDGRLDNGGNTGNLTFIQYGPIDHDQPGDGAEGSHDENASFNLAIKLTDDEGDSVTATATINIEDDGPVIASIEQEGESISVDESNLLGGNNGPGGTNDGDANNATPITASGQFETFDFGTDGELTDNLTTDARDGISIGLTSVSDHSGTDAVLLTSNGDLPVNLIQIGNVLYGYTGSVVPTAALTAADDNLVFTLSVDENGNYQYSQFQAVEHYDSSNTDEVLNLVFTVTITDGDNDTTSATISLTVHDDAIINNDATALVVGVNEDALTAADDLSEG
ncbi:DUF5801 repeats-in-toxin domain-containing protein, partial [Halopseudomonas sp.]|uniref:DUF5801 repeats-in-toxin domain-containing protein n=1 Tax=Halopseudomonas sp. TaxID=2901191 RepID=UPI0030038D56